VDLKFFHFVFSALLVFSLRSIAQNYTCSVEGRVVSQSSGKPLENVNVYISNTVWGTTTNKDGYFKIISLPFGNLTVVASMVGYGPKTMSIALKEGETAEVNFKLEERSYEINQVLVTGKAPKDWLKNLEEFKKYFLGDGPNTDECKILNPEVINLNKTESGDLSANASQPILIINNALGYKIRCDLVSFEWVKDKQTLQYIVEIYFTELKDTSGNLKKEWTRNREATYYGSMTDFIKSLMNNTYREEGFKVYKPLPFKYKSSYKSFYELDQQIIKKINDNYAELNFDGYLRIEYDSDISYKTLVSFIKLSFPDALIDKFGFSVVPLALTVYGDWAYSGVANMLPKYYNPEEEK
jgi:hypothetical protein